MKAPDDPHVPEGPAARSPESFYAEVEAAAATRQYGLLALLRQESALYAWAPDAARFLTRATASLEARATASREDQGPAPLKPVSSAPPRFPYAHAILFTGHRIDDPGRREPRVPAGSEAAARCAIEQALRELSQGSGPAVGLAGGASGGDLLFHELCGEHGIASLLRLTVPPERYTAFSVAPAGRAWEQRFATLLSRLGPDHVHVLGSHTALPRWMGEPHRRAAAYDPWQRTNAWLLADALALAPRRTLLALWDGEPGDNPGGTGHLVGLAEATPGFDVQVIPVPL